MEKEQHYKVIGFLFLLFLFFTYKEMLLDPYLGISKQHGITTTGQITAATSTTNPKQSFSVPGAVAAPGTNTSAAPLSPETKLPSDAQILSGGEITAENGVLRLNISLLGGRLRELRLLDYAERLAKDSQPLNIVDHIEHAPLPLGIYSGSVDDSLVQYKTQAQQNVRTSAGVDQSIVLEGQLPDGRSIKKTIILQDKNYLIGVNVELGSAPSDGSQMELEWSRIIPKESENFLDSRGTGGFVWFDGQRAHRQPFNALEVKDESFGNVIWTSVTDHYFAVSLISPKNPAPSRAHRSGELFLARLNGEPTTGNFLVYAGPKAMKTLESAQFALERNIDFGRLGFLSAPLLSLLHFFFSIFKNYGLAIVALTILVRLAALPLSAASFKSMKAMQEIQPEVQRIRDSVKDRQQQQLELMSLYKKKNINPLGGCFPVLIQLPVFFGLYSALLLAIELRHAPFALWVKDLSAPEKLVIGPVGIPVMVILFVISMLVQQWTTPSTMDATQKKIMLVMPLVFGFMFVNFPAGLTLYWLTSNIISIAQARALRGDSKTSPLIVTVGTAFGTLALAFVLTRF